MWRHFGIVCRPVRGTNMIDFNPVWIYHLAEQLTRIENIRTGTLLAHISTELHEARQAVQGFVGNQQHTIFPDTLGQAKDVLVWINVIMPPDQPVQNRPLEYAELLELTQAINRTVTTFETESTKKYIVGLEPQRALQPYTLIEQIETAIAPQCWKRLSGITKREIEECGKCLAFERYTAVGFHILRSVENELKDYVCLLTYARPAKRDLGYYIETLKSHSADAKLLAALDSIRSLDRNPLMHPEDWLEKDDAIGIFNIAQVALERLIADMERKKLLP